MIMYLAPQCIILDLEKLKEAISKVLVFQFHNKYFGKIRITYLDLQSIILDLAKLKEAISKILVVQFHNKHFWKMRKMDTCL